MKNEIESAESEGYWKTERCPKHGIKLHPGVRLHALKKYGGTGKISTDGQSYCPICVRHNSVSRAAKNFGKTKEECAELDERDIAEDKADMAANE